MAEKTKLDAKIRLTILIAVVVMALALPLAAAQSDSPAMTQQQAEEVLQQLKVLRQLLETQYPSQPVQTRVPDTGYSLGDPNAPVTLVEFSDYQCPFCAQFHNDSFAKLRQDFLSTGKVRLVMRDLPLAAHTNALKAAEAARCGGDQGKFWEMRGALVAHVNDLREESLFVYARQLGLEMGSFEQCLKGEKFLPEIQQDEADAKAGGITATPSFVLGKSEKGVVEGVRLVGAISYPRLAEQITKELAVPAKPAAIPNTGR